jgi:hypothetical protein
MIISVALITVFLNAPLKPAVARQAPTCLHDPATETQEQITRRQSALGLARTVNSAEAAFSSKAGVVKYADLGELVAQNFMKPVPASGEYHAGFELHIDTFDKGYWFAVIDKTDACGFRYISNQQGVIFTAEPIRR